MKHNLFNLSRRYQNALRTHLKQGRQASLESARGLGSQALDAGLQTLDLAKLHEQTLVAELLPGCPLEKRAALRHIGPGRLFKGAQRWRRGREAEGDGLLNRYRGNPIVGSNPTVSASPMSLPPILPNPPFFQRYQPAALNRFSYFESARGANAGIAY